MAVGPFILPQTPQDSIARMPLPAYYRLCIRHGDLPGCSSVGSEWVFSELECLVVDSAWNAGLARWRHEGGD